MMIDGMLVICKDAGYTSNDVVCKLRGILHMRKIGHTGTLDPEARGVLPVCLGNGTKLVPMIENTRKEYIAECRLGVTTDTQDMTGAVLTSAEEEKVLSLTKEQVLEALQAFTGDILQVPPMYSAIKQGGKKLYELARAGRVVERQARPVTVYSLELLEMKLPILTLRICCSKGTYIRTLCEDIGTKLGVGGCMESLLRTKVGQFTLEEALPLSEVERLAHLGEEAVLARVRSIESFFADLPGCRVREEALKALENGNPLSPADLDNPEGDRVRVCGPDGRFYGVYARRAGEELFRVERMFFVRDGGAARR